MESVPEQSRWRSALGLLRLLLGGLAIGLLFEWLGIPAGMMLGAAVGAALLNQPQISRMRRVEFPRLARQIALITIGLISGVLLTVGSLQSTASIALPIVGAYLLVWLIMLGFIALLMKKYQLDPATAVLSVIPGGLAEVMGMAMDKGAQISVVLTIHSVRLFAIVLILLPILLWVFAS